MTVLAAASNISARRCWTSLVAGGLVAGVPLMLTALGESISERSGVLNLGLEGMMLLGAYVGFIVAYYGALADARVHRRHGRRRGRRRGHAGSVRLARPRPDRRRHRDHVGRRGHHERSRREPSSAPATRVWERRRPCRSPCSTDSVLGPSLFNQPLVVYLGFALIGVLAWIFRKTNPGLNLRAAGEKPEALDAAGVGGAGHAGLCELASAV